MVLTITVVGNNQASGGPNGGHAVLSPDGFAQLMSGQAVTGMLNPDGSITLNSNVMSGQPLDQTIPTSIANEINTVQAPASYQGNPLPEPTDNVQQFSTGHDASSYNVQTPINVMSSCQSDIQTPPAPASTPQKKTPQKRLTAKQKLALQQQQLEQQQLQQHQQQQQHQFQQHHQMHSQQLHQDPQVHQTLADQQHQQQQPQIVATVQLPNGQIGQLIAPSGGQFWSPNAINLQQLSMAVAAATGAMPQSMAMPSGSSGQTIGQESSCQSIKLEHQDQSQQYQAQISPQDEQQQQQQSHSLASTQIDTQQQQQHDQQHLMEPQTQQQQQTLANNSQQQNHHQQQMMHIQAGQMIGRPQAAPNQQQLWSGGAISLNQLTQLAQQGVVQVAGIGPNGARVVEMLPQGSIRGLVNSAGQPVQAVSIANGGQFITQDPNDPSKWQLVPSSQIAAHQSKANQQQLQQQHHQMQLHQRQSEQNQAHQSSLDSAPTISTNNTSYSSTTTTTAGSTASRSFVVSSQGNLIEDMDVSGQLQSSQPQRKLKRLACTCPNCRDGDNNKTSNSGGDKKKQHICHYPDCNKVYGKTSHLRAHLRWHSGERPYVCNWSFCGKKFTRSDELQRHRRTHTGEKRFQCNECLKRFMRSDHLSKHLKTHLSSKKIKVEDQQAEATDTNSI